MRPRIASSQSWPTANADINEMNSEPSTRVFQMKEIPKKMAAITRAPVAARLIP